MAEGKEPVERGCIAEMDDSATHRTSRTRCDRLAAWINVLPPPASPDKRDSVLRAFCPLNEEPISDAISIFSASNVCMWCGGGDAAMATRG
jgi:hypothetical protein